MNPPFRPWLMAALICACLLTAGPSAASGAGAGAGGEGSGGLSLTGFGGLDFGTPLTEIKRRFQVAKIEYDRRTGEGTMVLRRRMILLGRSFAVRLNISRGRLQEVVYSPLETCAGTCLTGLKVFFEARLGSRPEVLPGERADEPTSWLWTTGRAVDKGRLVSVTVNLLQGRLMDIYVTDQSDQQVILADGPGPDGGLAAGGGYIFLPWQGR